MALNSTNREIIFKDRVIADVASKLNLAKSAVSDIYNNYIYYLQENILSGYTVKVFDICYLKYDKKGIDQCHQTQAYLASIIAYDLDLCSDIVIRVLNTISEYIFDGLKEGKCFVIKGLIRIRLEEENGKVCVRSKKSTYLNGMNVRISMLGSYKRRLGVA